MNTMQLGIHAQQSQVLSPRLQQAVKLLQMSSLDFAAMVRSKLDENPFLEEDDDTETVPPAMTLDGNGSSSGGTDGGDAAPEADNIDISGDPISDQDLWAADRHITSRTGDEGDASAMDLSACEKTLSMHLQIQLGTMPLGDRDRALTGAIVESLDEDGYLRTPLAELALALPLEPPAKEIDWMIALRLVQSLDPVGVAARSVEECLLLQCAGIEDDGVRALAQAMIRDHLDALSANDIGGLSLALGKPPPRIMEAMDRIRRLDARPGWKYGSSHVDYIVPDVVVRKNRSGWSVQLNPMVIPRVRLNRVYERLFQQHRTSEHAQLGSHLQEARWTLRNVEQRFATILDVARAIVRRQTLFLEYGAMAMKPLILREIAEEVGMHESTVSRVTNSKHMATPLGVFELKHFFSRPMLSASGQACSATAIRELIAEIISGEDAARPLSDGDITRKLASQGLVIARRTVTKYRQLLHIEPREKRLRLC